MSEVNVQSTEQGNTDTVQAQPAETQVQAEGTAAVAPEASKATATEQDVKSQDTQAKADTSVAEELQIKLPDGVAKDELFDKFTPLAKELGLKSESAQKLVDLYLSHQKSAMQKAQESRLERATAWAEEAKADKEIGGVSFDKNVAAGQRALQQFGNSELVELLNASGLGNHKAVIRFFAKVGHSVSEDKMPNGSAGVQSTEKDVLRALYPTMFKGE